MAIKLTHDGLERRIKELEKEAAGARAVEEALKEKERFLTQMIQGSPIPTFMVNRDHTITHCNKAFESLIEVPVDQILGSKQWLDAAASKKTHGEVPWVVLKNRPSRLS